MLTDTAYYYDVDGAQIQLQPTENVAIDLAAAAKAALLDDDLLRRIERHGNKLRRDVVLLDRSELPDRSAEALDSAGALQPVFRADDGALVVVLPEVRIEAADKRQVRAIRTCLNAADVASEIVRDEGEHLVVRPKSQRGADALELANRIAETVEPPMAQARFLRVVPRPTVRASGKRSAARGPS